MTVGEDEAGVPVGPTERMIDHVIWQLQEARRAEPLRRLHALSSAQRHLAWATRWSVAEHRAQGASWTDIARFLGEKQHSTIARQFQGGGPVVVARPGDNGQGPLREAVMALSHVMVPTQELANSPAGQLYGPVGALMSALGNTQDPQPMLRHVAYVLERAARLRAGADTGEGCARTQEEQRVWDAVDVLNEVYERDRDLIEAVAAIEPTTPGNAQ
jgi:hypothetical protein